MNGEELRYSWGEHEGRVIVENDGFKVIDCEKCGFRHVVPVPSPEELENIYKHEYYTKEKPLYLERYQQDLDWWNLVYDERLDTLEELAGSENRRLLDIGSGPGYFLKRAQERGWSTLGIEPSKEAWEFSTGLGVEVFNDLLTEENAGSFTGFDAVNLSEVLEHIPDPAAFLKLIHGCLSDGGGICIAVPNDFSWVQEAAVKERGLDSWWVAPPHHLNYFDFDSLSALVERCGFSVETREATFPIDLFLLMNRIYIGDDTVGRECHTMRMNMEKAMRSAGFTEKKRELYRAFADQGIGREVVIFATKK